VRRSDVSIAVVLRQIQNQSSMAGWGKNRTLYRLPHTTQLGPREVPTTQTTGSEGDLAREDWQRTCLSGGDVG